MDEEILGNKKYAYALYALSAALLAGAAGLYAKLIVPAIIALALSVAYFHSGQIINTLVLQKKKIVAVSGNYYLSKSMVSAVRRVGGGYEGVSVAVVHIDHTPRSEADLFDALLERLDTSFEFIMSLEPFDKRKVMEGLRTRRSMKEIELSHTRQDKQAKIGRLKRELSFIDGEIAQLNNGSKPFMTAFKLRCSAYAAMENEAARESANSVERVAQAFSATFDASYTLLKGSEILALL